MAQVRRSVSEAFWAMCAADSMSMPVHWYYDIDDIRRDFGGWISGFKSPRSRHPSSILSLSNTSRKLFHGVQEMSPGSSCVMFALIFLFVCYSRQWSDRLVFRQQAA